MERVVSAIATLAVLAACSASPQDEVVLACSPPGYSDLEITVSEGEGENWTLDFAFADPQTILITERSHNAYRVDMWRPTTDGITFTREGELDVIRSETPTQCISFDITPNTSNKLVADYTPFTPFTGGGYSIYLGQFNVLPVVDEDALSVLDGKATNWNGPEFVHSYVVRADETILIDGVTTEGEGRADTGTFAYVGPIPVVTGESYSMVLDPGMPVWVRSSVSARFNSLFATLDERWEFPLEQRASVLFAFTGFEKQGYSLSGGALTDLMMLDVSGDALEKEHPQISSHLNWFLAHESVHLYQQVLMEDFTTGANSWIHEGGANAMANAILAEDPTSPDDYFLNAFNEAFTGCVQMLEEGPLSTAFETGRFYAYYNCGEVIQIASDRLLEDQDLFSIWRDFTARIKDDNLAPDEAYYTSLEAFGAPERFTDLIREITETTLDTPRETIVALLEAGQLVPEFDNETGKLTSIAYP